MDVEAEDVPLVNRQNLSSDGFRDARTVHFAKNAAPAHAGGAASPASAAVFELEEDESGPLVGRGSGAERRDGAAPAAERDGMPLWVIPLLTAAVFAVSSAGAVFKLMGAVPPLSLAAWRLQLTTLLLLPGCIVNFRGLSPELQRRTLRSYGLFLISGTSLALHFGCWVWGIEHTSLIHAYLCVSTTPIIIAGGTWLLRRPISWGELGGTFLGAVGTVLLTLGPAAKGSQITLVGDLVTLCAAVTIIGYFEVGQRLRMWMPIFLYACPATGIAAFLLTIGAIALEGARFGRLGIGGVFGWLSKDYLLGIGYLAIVPGIVGHTGLNTVLKYISPLVITLSTTTEPLIGACIGYFILGVMSAPNAFIYIGGGIIFVATGIVTVAQHRRKLEAASAAKQSALLTKGQPDDFSVGSESEV